MSEPIRWSEVTEDRPIPHLQRQLIKGEKALVAKVLLFKGCHVAMHSHESEQIAVVVGGKPLWTVAGIEHILEGGSVFVIPSNVPHSVVALEDSEVMDILSPPGPMGVDSQKLS
ncbi:MAG TPA: cupin domain-containing protein [Fimbriimonadaceae bacterium]|jgi:quercetin dioxygenase-like cupin family protein